MQGIGLPVSVLYVDKLKKRKKATRKKYYAEIRDRDENTCEEKR